MIAAYPYKKITEDIFEINEFDGVSMFLIIGRDRALLMDTGVGIGDISGFIRTITDKPLDIFLTHNHRDHVGNAPLFPAVHISRIDHLMGDMVRPWTSAKSRLHYADHIRKRYPDRVYPWLPEDIRSFSESEEPAICEMEDGYMFDLGGRQVACYLCPGHTPGSMVAIDSKTGFLFCGDSCNKFTGLGVRPVDGLRHASVEESLNALKRIWHMEFDHEMIFNAHADFRKVGEPLQTYVYPRLMQGMEQILSGDYVIRKEWIQVLDVIVETAVFDDISVQFHTDNIFRGEREKDA